MKRLSDDDKIIYGTVGFFLLIVAIYYGSNVFITC